MSHLFVQADAIRTPLADQSIDFCIGSPPYVDARSYLEDGEDLGIARDTDSWISWMLRVTNEAVRVTRGCVIWVAAGVTRDRNYQSACEGLMDAWRRRMVPSGVWQDGIELPGTAGSMYRPVYWHRVGICGSGGDQWFRADVELCMCFKRPGKLPFANNTANGHPPKWAPGGEMSHRLTDGTRRNQWGHSGTGEVADRRKDGSRGTAQRSSHVRTTMQQYREGASTHHTYQRPDGTMEVQGYVPPAIANPGNLVHVDTGGGKLGWFGAHENEAPYPQELAEWFIRSLCPPGGTVVDFFSGSGTTVRAANALGRKGIGFDLRMSQCRLGRRGSERPHAPVAKASRKKDSGPMMFLGIPLTEED